MRGYSPQLLQLATLGYSTTGQTLFSLSYGYAQNGGNDGQITAIADGVQSGRGVAYTYDALSRLKTAVTTGSSWTYDRYANRLSQALTTGSGPTSSLTIDPASNRISGFSYDANGNLTWDQAYNYGYDAENRLVNFANGSATYSYDGNSLRVKKVAGSTTTVYVFSGTTVLAEYTNGAAATSPGKEYVYLAGTLMATIAGGSTTYHHRDHLSARVTTDSNGNIVAEQGHYPYGESWYSGSQATKWQFTTYERDAESGNDYATFRFYFNRFGRFGSPDPIAGVAGDPQTWNRYAYVGNNPCSATDPLGLDTCNFNVQLNNSAGLSPGQVTSIEQRIQQLFGAVQSPNGDSVGINFSFTGRPDATLNVRNSPWFMPGSVFGVQGRGWNPTVFWDTAQAYNPYGTTTFAGSVGAHELAHQFLARFPWWGSSDLPYDRNNPNMMMFDSAPDAAQLSAIPNPASALWRFTSSQVGTLFSKCRKAHPVSTPASGGGRGGGGGGGNEFWFEDWLLGMMESLFGGGGGGGGGGEVVTHRFID